MSTPGEGIMVLPMERENLEAPNEAKRCAAPCNNASGGSREANIGIPRKPLVRASRYMGHVREAKGEILVVGDI